MDIKVVNLGIPYVVKSFEIADRDGAILYVMHDLLPRNSGDLRDLRDQLDELVSLSERYAGYRLRSNYEADATWR